ncbi:CopG domain-containing protein [Candidatus Paraburkholderia calva]|nr:CopG domain-containing protein [Candidatus Paraburkholderia calva]
MTKQARKQRLSVYLDPPVMKALAEHAARRDHSRSLVAEAAIVRGIDQLDRRLACTECNVGIAIEMLAVFVRFWLATTSALPEPAAKAARADFGQRYDAFVAALGRRLAKGPKLRQEISKDMAPSEADR